MGRRYNKAGRLLFCLLISTIAIIASSLISMTFSCGFRTLERSEETREMMGTYVTIIIYSPGDRSREILESAFGRMQEISDIASIYDPESQVSELNRQGEIKEPSRELEELITLSREYYDISGGSFDITISPVLKLWQEGLWMESAEIQQKKIREALELVGSDMIKIDESGIYFEKEGMSVDMGGIAKGYAVDAAMEIISGYGIESALINAGGDIGTIGKKADGGKWVVELDDPGDLDNINQVKEPLPSFEFEDMAVATSGNYYRYYDPDREVHHITDPHTGYSANGCISATVIAEDCTEADVLATTVFVKGPVKGMDFIEEMESVEGLIIDSDGNMFGSSGLFKYIK